jgi:subtilase family serine protease
MRAPKIVTEESYMKRLRTFLLGLASAAVFAACGGGVPSTTEHSSTRNVPQWQVQHSATRACPETPERPQCNVLIIRSDVQPDVAGWVPSDLQAAYNLPSSSKGSGQIVAIVDAYDNPNVASDLAEYRSHFGLPAANFTKYNQVGQQGNYPMAQAGWGSEIDLDVQMVSASCPNCTIYLIEANSNSDSNFDIAEKEAAKLGAHIISNSWYCEGCKLHPSDFDDPGVTYLASSGDGGYGAASPAGLEDVVAVGGTILAKRGSKYREAAWPDTGGGCASGVDKPSWQHDPGCTSRTTNDVAAVAWGVATYDTYGYGGWLTTGGTSVSSPLVAGIYGLAGNAGSQHGGKSLWMLTKQERKKDLHVINRGSDGDCGGSYLCTAGTGQFGSYSGPSGWGTPNGIGAF